MRLIFALGFLSSIFFSSAASAELKRITDRSEFVTIVEGRSLTRPLIKLFVTADGNITGSGATLPVSGSWTWKDGFFCRDMTWGKRELGYNCQEVRADSVTIRFTSDQGTGDFADFKLR